MQVLLLTMYLSKFREALKPRCVVDSGMVLWDCVVLPYLFDFDTCIKVKLDSSWRIHTNFPTLIFQWRSLGPLILSLCCFVFALTFLTEYMYSLNLEI